MWGPSGLFSLIQSTSKHIVADLLTVLDQNLVCRDLLGTVLT